MKKSKAGQDENTLTSSPATINPSVSSSGTKNISTDTKQTVDKVEELVLNTRKFVEEAPANNPTILGSTMFKLNKKLEALKNGIYRNTIENIELGI